MKWTDHLTRSLRRPVRKSSRPRRLLSLELLEDRCVPSIAADAFEPNDTPAAATILNTVSGTVRHDNLSIHDSSDQDWFRFNLALAGSSSAQINFDGAPGNLDLELYDSDGSTLLDQSSSIGGTETVSLTGLATGKDYYLRVLGFNGAVNPSYSLQFDAPSPPVADSFEPNATQDSASDLGTLTGPNTFSNLSIDSATDRDWYRIGLPNTGGRDSQVQVSYDGSQGNLGLSLYDSEGNLLASKTDAGSRQSISLQNLAGGTYSIQVFGIGGATNNYTMTIVAPPPIQPDVHEANETLNTATNLGTLAGPDAHIESDLSIHTTADVDWFKFTTLAVAGSSQKASINFQHTEGDLDLYLYGANGTLLRSSAGTGNTESVSLSGLAGGTYYVKVVGASGAVNPSYSLTINAPADPKHVQPDSLEDNNSVSKATLLHTGTGTTLSKPQSINDLSITPGDVDYLKFTTVATGTAADSIRIEFSNADGNLTLKLLDANGAVLKTAATKGDTETISLEGLGAGTYYASVSGANAQVANTYTFAVKPPNAPGKLDSWTIMVYMTASTLYDYGPYSINLMEEAVSKLPGSVNIAALYDQSSDVYDSDGYTVDRFATGNGTQKAWGGTGRAFITGDGHHADPFTDPIATYFDTSIGEKDTGDGQTLQDFVTWATTAAPADHYALIFWDHGGGADGGFNYDDTDTNSTGNALYPAEAAAAIAASGIHLDLTAFDACNMAMPEIAYTFRDVTTDYAASEETVGGLGLDYSNIFNPLLYAPRQVSADTLAAGVVHSYEDQYAHDGSLQDTYSAVRTSALGGLTSALDAFVTAAGSPSQADLDTLEAARSSASAYSFSGYRDLGGFMNAIVESAASDGIRTAAQGVLDALNAALVARSNDERQSSGLSIYTPDQGEKVDSLYLQKNTDFLAATGWNAFIDRLDNKTSAGKAEKDWSEPNNIKARAFDLRQLQGGSHTFNALTLPSLRDRDWFRFTTGTAGDVRASVTPADLTQSMHLTLFSSDGTQQLGDVTAAGGASLTLNGLPAGTYLAEVQPDGASIADYSLTIKAPGTRVLDWAGNNSTPGKAYPLGTVGTNQMYSGLEVGARASDWFSFMTPRLPQSQLAEVVATVDGSAPVTIQIRDRSNHVLSSAAGTGTLILSYRAPGSPRTYRIFVTGNRLAAVPYSLRFTTNAPVKSLVGITSTGQVWYAESNSSHFTNRFLGTWNGPVGSHPTTVVEKFSGDFTGDGRPDLLIRNSDGEWLVLKNSGFNTQRLVFGVWGAKAGWRDTQIGDFDGDGKLDVLSRNAAGQWFLGHNTGHSFTRILYGNWDPKMGWHDTFAGDFNNDGKLDVISRDSNGHWLIGRNTGTGFDNVAFGAWIEQAHWRNTRVGDFTGDGKPDVVSEDALGGLWVGQNTGNEFQLVKFGSRDSLAGWQETFTGDFDGDGTLDVLSRNSGGQWWLASNTGQGFSLKLFATWDPKAGWHNTQVGDFTGDGKIDVVSRTKANLWYIGENIGDAFRTMYFGTWNDINFSQWDKVTVTFA